MEIHLSHRNIEVDLVWYVTLVLHDMTLNPGSILIRTVFMLAWTICTGTPLVCMLVVALVEQLELTFSICVQSFKIFSKSQDYCHDDKQYTCS